MDLSWGLHRRPASEADLLDLSWTEMDNLDDFSPSDCDSYLDLESELSGLERTTADTMNSSSSDEDNDDNEGEDGEDVATIEEEEEEDGATEKKRQRTQKCWNKYAISIRSVIINIIVHT